MNSRSLPLVQKTPVTSILLGHQSVKVTEKFYAARTSERQRQPESDLEREWERDPVDLQEEKNMLKLHGKTEFVN